MIRMSKILNSCYSDSRGAKKHRGKQTRILLITHQLLGATELNGFELRSLVLDAVETSRAYIWKGRVLPDRRPVDSTASANVWTPISGDLQLAEKLPTNTTGDDTVPKMQ